ncbi:MAG: helix-turn-helix transcriptional regulator [Deltaproteobacteria bacterium]|nr:helix-turn-helix transcriptional regulator [Deltaproteobacteria bacterium]
MEKEEFVEARTKLDKTQKEMSQLLGVSVKAIYSYEQGWRSVPTHVERQIFFLLSRKRGARNLSKAKPCWTIKKCPPKRRRECPAYEYNAGKFCWLVNGTICECKAQENWKEKMKICRECSVMNDLL